MSKPLQIHNPYSQDHIHTEHKDFTVYNI